MTNKGMELQTPNPDNPDVEPQGPTSPDGPRTPDPAVEPPGNPNPNPYPVEDPMPGGDPTVPTPPEPIPEYPPDVNYRVASLGKVKYSKDGHGRDDQPQYHAFQQRPVAEFFHRIS